MIASKKMATLLIVVILIGLPSRQAHAVDWSKCKLQFKLIHLLYAMAGVGAGLAWYQSRQEHNKMKQDIETLKLLLAADSRVGNVGSQVQGSIARLNTLPPGKRDQEIISLLKSAAAIGKEKSIRDTYLPLMSKKAADTYLDAQCYEDLLHEIKNSIQEQGTIYNFSQRIQNMPAQDPRRAQWTRDVFDAMKKDKRGLEEWAWHMDRGQFWVLISLLEDKDIAAISPGASKLFEYPSYESELDKLPSSRQKSVATEVLRMPVNKATNWANKKLRETDKWFEEYSQTDEAKKSEKLVQRLNDVKDAKPSDPDLAIALATLASMINSGNFLNEKEQIRKILQSLQARKVENAAEILKLLPSSP